MIRKEIITICEQAICKELGSLNDLPRELANTVAYIFYKYHSGLIENTHMVDNPTSIQQVLNTALADRRPMTHGGNMVRQDCARGVGSVALCGVRVAARSDAGWTWRCSDRAGRT